MSSAPALEPLTPSAGASNGLYSLWEPIWYVCGRQLAPRAECVLILFVSMM